MSKEDKIKDFDPSGTGDQNLGIYGLPFEIADADVAILPVPWEVTVSYRAGTARGPAAIRMASYQVDLFDEDVPDAWKLGIALDEVSPEWVRKNIKHRKNAFLVIDYQETGTGISEEEAVEITREVTEVAEHLNRWVEGKCLEYLEAGKIPVVLGGDHSTPLGLMKALSRKFPSYGILQIDAHADLRDAYEGFTYSHASIMFNALKIPQVEKLVQVGIRDVCEDEVEIARNSGGRVSMITWRDICAGKFKGQQWDEFCSRVVEQLPKHVYISFDIDGLDPSLCPHTGTPVPGGLQFEEAVHLIRKVVESGRIIIGFDLVEVAPGTNEWDASVGARLLYKMSNFAGKSQGKI